MASRKHTGLIVLLVVHLAAGGAPLRAADPAVAELLAGKTVPLTITLKDLDASWRKLTPTDGGAQPLAGWYALALGGLGGSSALYTRGQTVAIGDTPYLVAYRLAAKPVDMPALLRGGGRPDQLPKPEPPTPDTPLQLCLVNLRTTALLGDIQPFNLELELTGGDASPEALGRAREEVARAAGLENLQKLGGALLAYAADGDKSLPPMTDAATARTALLPYAGGREVFTPTSGTKPYQPNPALSGKKLSAIADPAKTVAFYEAAPADAPRGVLFLDGRVARVTAEEWKTLQTAGRLP